MTVEKLPTIEEMQAGEWCFIRQERNRRIAKTAFEYERNSREQRLSLAVSRSVAWMTKLDEYVQSLADLPQAYNNPFEVVWPLKPE